MQELIDALNQLRRQADNIDREMVSQIKDKGTYSSVSLEMAHIDTAICNALFDIGKHGEEARVEEAKAELQRMNREYMKAVL